MVRLNRTYYSLLKSTSKIVWYGLTVHIIRFSNYKQNFQKIVFPSQILANYTNSAQFAHTVREPRKIRTFLLTYSILCFRHLLRQRTLQNSSELRKFRATRPHSPRITRNSHHLLILHLTFQIPDQWQRTP